MIMGNCFIHLLLVFVTATVASSMSHQCQQYGFNQSSLLMDVLWVLQGRHISFSGFFVEFLGFSSAFRDMLPMGRLMKSFFNDSLDEEPMRDRNAMFNRGLFPKESEALNYVMINQHPDIAELNRMVHNNHMVLPSSKYIQEASDTSIFCNASIGRWDEGQIMVGGDLSRSKYQSEQNPIVSAVDCCLICSRQPLCVAWTFDYDGFRCSLKGARTSELHPSSTAVTGHMVGIDPKTGSKTGVAPKPKAVIFHGTTCAFLNMSVQSIPRDINTIYIGRFMLERPFFDKGSTLDEVMVTRCAGLMDEIWVPTEWHAKIFHNLITQNFGKVPFITVVPEVVDTELFDGKDSSRNNTLIDKDTDGVIRMENIMSNVAGEVAGPLPPIKRCEFQPSGKLTCGGGNQKFEFLSVFKWEYRKGWDILLRAYWNAFGVDDDVILRIRSYIPSTDKGKMNVLERIQVFARETFGKELHELAAVAVESGELELKSDALSRAQVRDMLAAADAFVLPTRGEGWGLPISEAMAMELPVIVTNCPGPQAYANHDNAYLIEVESEMDKWSYAIPKVDNLQTQLRQVIIDSSLESGAAKQKTSLARQKMKDISAASAMCLIIDRLKFQAERRGFAYNP